MMHNTMTRDRVQTRNLQCLLLPCLMVLLLASCGGGGGNGQPVPQPNLPDPVEELSEADIAQAGIPAVGSLGSSSAGRAASLSVAGGDWNGDGIDDIGPPSFSRNIVLGQDGDDLLLQVPESDLERRIVGWAMFELPIGADSHLAWLQTNLESGGNARWFYALANFGSQRWEVGGAVFAQNFQALKYNADGSLSPSAKYNFRRSFSQSQDYVSPQGNAYLLLLAGHPGNASVSGYINSTDLWEWRSINDSASVGFGEGRNGSLNWSASSTEGGGLWNDVHSTLGYIEQDNIYKQDFSFDDTAGSEHILFALPFNLLPGGEPGEPTTVHNTVNAADYTIWRNGFFSIGEMNGWQHPFTMHREGGAEQDLNAAPLLQLPGSQGLGIIAILVGITGPIPDAELSMLVAGDEISIKTGKAGQLTIPLNFFGTDTFTYTLKYDGGSQPLEVELELDPEAGIYRFR